MISLIKRFIKPLVLTMHTRENKKFMRTIIEENKEEIIERNQVVSKLSGNKILVLAPHVDDDIIGCGGAIVQYLREGKDVHIAYLTNGQGKGTPGLKEEEIIEERKKEAFAVADNLGLPKTNLYFLEARDSELLTTDIHCDLKELIQSNSIDTIFFPSIIDTHVDHYATSKKLYELYAKDEELVKDITLMMYEVQSPISPIYSTIILNITREFDIKKKLLKNYKSQTNKFYFLPIMNRLNGLVIDRDSMAEVFIKTDFKSFTNFVNQNFSDNEKYYNYKKELVAHRDHRNTIATYKNVLKYKEELLKL
ncbi:PIG-L deacetylase family protein [Guptibacillus algicola]|uniref:PIG-L deacetylase family protein n=1 Tax=Guptibacillus algicola TaxID=225844 RepID=UPI001CD3F49E|nr:PIG-L family deacetylase [Alkalihalobacillus algicola]MCA0986858.1 PIG-L family deacetylase [Alkalihalobacillus algicola]